jgi:hypothetical protein
MAGGLQALPQTFTYTEARRQGLSDRALYALRDQGSIEPIGRGLYRRADSGEAADIDLLEIAYRAPEATICLTSALARHALTDQIPAVIDIGMYSPPRCIIDAFRLRHREGTELAQTALRRWLDRPGTQPSEVLAMARHFPQAEPALRTTLEILL